MIYKGMLSCFYAMVKVHQPINLYHQFGKFVGHACVDS